MRRNNHNSDNFAILGAMWLAYMVEGRSGEEEENGEDDEEEEKRMNSKKI